MTEPVRIGVVGGGLMGRELLALTRRWTALVDHPSRPEVVALADPAPKDRTPSVPRNRGGPLCCLTGNLSIGAG